MKYFVIKNASGMIVSALEASDGASFSAEDGTPAIEYADQATAEAAEGQTLLDFNAKGKINTTIGELWNEVVDLVRDANGVWWDFRDTNNKNLLERGLRLIGAGADYSGHRENAYEGQTVTFANNAEIQALDAALTARYLACSAAYDADEDTINGGGEPSALAAIYRPVDADVVVGDVWQGHPTTPTTSGIGIALATFDGELCTVAFNGEWPDANYVPTVTISGDGVETVNAPIIGTKTTTGFEFTLTESLAQAQAITAHIKVR